MKFPSRLKSYLSILQNVRNDADYKAKSVSGKLASKQLKMAGEFAVSIEKELNRV